MAAGHVLRGVHSPCPFACMGAQARAFADGRVCQAVQKKVAAVSCAGRRDGGQAHARASADHPGRHVSRMTHATQALLPCPVAADVWAVRRAGVLLADTCVTCEEGGARSWPPIFCLARARRAHSSGHGAQQHQGNTNPRSIEHARSAALRSPGRRLSPASRARRCRSPPRGSARSRRSASSRLGRTACSTGPCRATRAAARKGGSGGRRTAKRAHTQHDSFCHCAPGCSAADRPARDMAQSTGRQVGHGCGFPIGQRARWRTGRRGRLVAI